MFGSTSLIAVIKRSVLPLQVTLLSKETGRVGERKLWGWLNTVFNKVDPTRIEAVGPDRACAEWLLRCGASVKWAGADKALSDYNSLPPESTKLYIEEVDATDSAVMHIGFTHFKGVKRLKKIIFHRSTYIDDEAMAQLVYLKDSLQHLQVSSCGNVTSKGVLEIRNLSNLKYALVYDLPQVENREECINELKKALPQCTIEFPYAQASEQESMKKKEEAADKQKTG